MSDNTLPIYEINARWQIVSANDAFCRTHGGRSKRTRHGISTSSRWLAPASWTSNASALLASNRGAAEPVVANCQQARGKQREKELRERRHRGERGHGVGRATETVTRIGGSHSEAVGATGSGRERCPGEHARRRQAQPRRYRTGPDQVESVSPVRSEAVARGNRLAVRHADGPIGQGRRSERVPDARWCHAKALYC